MDLNSKLENRLDPTWFEKFTSGKILEVEVLSSLSSFLNSFFLGIESKVLNWEF